MKIKLPFFIIFVVWTAVILVVFFILQPSALVQYSMSIFALFCTIIYECIFVSVGVGLGYSLLSKLWIDNMAAQRLIFSAGLGMGIMGIFGFVAAGIGIANGWFMLLLLIGILAWLVRKGYARSIWGDFLSLWAEVSDSTKYAPKWILWIAPAFFCLSVILSLGPRVEAFDSLSYHLAAPQWWLRDGGIASINMLQYWFPSLMEGMFVWPLSLGLDLTPQLIHLTFSTACALLVWDWSRLKFGNRAAWWSLAFYLGMPSIPLLSTWAYTDLALVFYTLAALLSLVNWSETYDYRWILVCGSMAGFAMGIKYTSFILPVTVLLCLIWRLWNTPKKMPAVFVGFSGLAVLTGFPWYLRNLIWTGNPVYPFVFGGLYWDTFRANWLAHLGSGIGWNGLKILLLPFITTLGVTDRYYIDGRIGPFYLIVFPLVIWALWSARKKVNHIQSTIFMIPLIFFILSAIFWTFGVVQSRELMQARLLWPALIPLLPLMSTIIRKFEEQHSSFLNYSFVFSFFSGMSLFILLFEFFIFVINNTPLQVTIGLESRAAYMTRVRPDYAEALSLVSQTPLDSFVYLLYEPRSFGMDRHVQPDAILDNLAHDFYLYPTNDSLLISWRKIGYSHVLARKKFINADEAGDAAFTKMEGLRLRKLLGTLTIVAETDDFILFSIPALK